MHTTRSIVRYMLIIEILELYGEASYNQIKNYVDNSNAYKYLNDKVGVQFELTERTFQRDKLDMKMNFDIEIIYSKSKNRYYLKEESSLESKNLIRRFSEAELLLNYGKINQQNQAYIQFENRKTDTLSLFHEVLHAIKERKILQFQYESYVQQNVTEIVGEPYILKEFRYRWYILLKNLKTSLIHTYALERISNLMVTSQTFQYPTDLKTDDFFRNSYGITYTPNDAPVSVVLSCSPVQAKYLESLPLHHSQQIVSRSEEEVIVSLKLCITHELYMELLSMCDCVSVVEPLSLRDAIKSALELGLSYYG